eukprot:CAMPEP_0173289408 /NCGR_PEP_ID=MMETSP1143-20121109/10979_1 /TAXON_ID=483371 /ORGANISM="non described non described, Strain CCMP2298" /LENGTH=49 /DNA_ID=CAMNT_0014228327 /DNA_START=545 /DNA_END=694 /DNA_ORIENTATION=-
MKDAAMPWVTSLSAPDASKSEGEDSIVQGGRVAHLALALDLLVQIHAEN